MEKVCHAVSRCGRNLETFIRAGPSVNEAISRCGRQKQARSLQRITHFESGHLPCVRASWKFLRKVFDDVFGLRSAFTRGMTKPACTYAILKIQNHVVIVLWGGTHGHCVEMKLVANFPRNHVIGA